MRLLIGTLFTLLVAAIVGLGATYLSLTRGAALRRLVDRRLDRVAENRHRRHRPLCAGGDRARRPSADRARRRRGFLARADDKGRPLDGRCDVDLTGITPAARFWTLTLYDADGELVANSVNRYGFTSQEIVRRADGSFEITIAPRASAGQLAADRRRRALHAGAAVLRHLGRRLDQGRPRSADARAQRRGAAHDPLAADVARGRAARRHRAFGDHLYPAAHSRRRTPIRGWHRLRP